MLVPFEPPEFRGFALHELFTPGLLPSAQPTSVIRTSVSTNQRCNRIPYILHRVQVFPSIIFKRYLYTALQTNSIFFLIDSTLLL